MFKRWDQHTLLERPSKEEVSEIFCSHCDVSGARSVESRNTMLYGESPYSQKSVTRASVSQLTCEIRSKLTHQKRFFRRKHLDL